MKSLFPILILLIATGLHCDSNSSNGDEPGSQTLEPTSLFIGTYTRDEGWVNGKADGIYSASISEDGSVSLIGTAAEVINPSFVAVSPDRNNLYAVSELGRGNEPTGYIHAFTIEEDGSLTFIEKYPSNAKSPAHVSVDATGSMVFASNYNGGVAVVYARNEDGSLEFRQQLDHEGSGPHPNQNSSHPHMAKISPDNNFLFIPDLGSDKVWSYSIDQSSQTVSKTEQEFAALEAGSGPRHMDFHPTLNIAYVMNELNSSVSVFSYNPDNGALEELQVISTLPDGFSEWNSTADIHVHPNGNFLYGSNRGHNSIVSFNINSTTGLLTELDHTSTRGEFPRNFAILPNGDQLFVANQNTDDVYVFNIDGNTGALSYSGESLDVPTPVCVVFY
ncbi:MAG: lactonase family protein [Balneola sp.]|nr:MAG: lactonase family protein [Balneola sp.]